MKGGFFLNPKYMKRAIELAKKGIGYTNPNPIVGCVVVKNDEIISEGYHEKIGGFHAERNALTNCKEDTTGAELYVTLEPCCHYGKTPPCTEIIIEKKIPVGYIPTGTTNDFASSLHIPKNLLQAASTAAGGKEFPCDIGRFNGDVFVYIAAFGLFTDVSYETKQEMKNVLGHLAYVLEGATRIFDIPSYKLKVTHDGETIEDEFIYGMVTNSRSVGGFRNMIGKNVVFDDGEFEVTLIRTPKNPLALQEIIGALLSSQINTKHIYSFKTGEIHFESVEEIPWTLDGEFGGEHDSVCIKNAKQALKIVVPEEEQ